MALDKVSHPKSQGGFGFQDIHHPQLLVEAAFLAFALCRAPTILWKSLDTTIRFRLTEALRSTRRIRPYLNNWQLFSAMIERFLLMSQENWDPMRVEFALQSHSQWYKGDGIYGDGPEFHWDYYNSYVIHPFLREVSQAFSPHLESAKTIYKETLLRYQRYVIIQERSINADGSFAPIGRSLTYRSGAFHGLAELAFLGLLPPGLDPSQVRNALELVQTKTLNAENTFNAKGWLNIGLYGSQPGLGEHYISTGSLYLTSFSLLPLGLAPESPFWSQEAKLTTSQLIWSGMDCNVDSALPIAIGILSIR